VTAYIAAYDVEGPGCLAACEKIVAVHRKFEMPATFYIVGRLLEGSAAAFRRLLDDPLFEIASHTYSHRMLRDHPFCGSSVAGDDLATEIVKGKRIVEDVFERPCLGMRPGCSFDVGLRGAPEVLKLVDEAGYRYVSSLAWGPDFTLPAPLNQPFAYAEDGYPNLWELPCHGWHDNVIKPTSALKRPLRVAWPIEFPGAVPAGHVQTPEEEFRIDRVLLDAAAERGLQFVSLVWHPWSLDRFDPDMRMLRLVFAHARALGLAPTTYADLYGQLGGPKP